MVISREKRDRIYIKGLSSDPAEVAAFMAGTVATKKHPGFRISKDSTVCMSGLT